MNKLIALCPICNQEIKSDALAKNYCKLCGMIIDGSENRFCCDDCKYILKKMENGKT